jgi:hypothetical protein
MLFLYKNAPDSCLVPLLVPRVPPEPHRPHQDASEECAQHIVFRARGAQTTLENVPWRRPMLLSRFAERQRFPLQRLQTQMSESVGVLRPEGPNLYSHL